MRRIVDMTTRAGARRINASGVTAQLDKRVPKKPSRGETARMRRALARRGLDPPPTIVEQTDEWDVPAGDCVDLASGAASRPDYATSGVVRTAVNNFHARRSHHLC